MYGPFNAPMTLASRPAMALFWMVFAPTVFMLGLGLIGNSLSGGWLSDTLQPGMPAAPRWLIFCVIQASLFAALTLWSDRVGAGPLGGPLAASADWVAIGALTGPLVLLLTSGLAASFFADSHPYWPYREAFDVSLVERAAFGPAMLVLVILVAPLLEEVTFRGVGMGCLLARGWSPLAAVVLTSALFTALHFQYVLPALVPIFLIGLYLGALRILSGGIAAPIAAHISANAVSLLAFSMSAPPA